MKRMMVEPSEPGVSAKKTIGYQAIEEDEKRAPPPSQDERRATPSARYIHISAQVRIHNIS